MRKLKEIEEYIQKVISFEGDREEFESEEDSGFSDGAFATAREIQDLLNA
jgi:hypothetical protein